MIRRKTRSGETHEATPLRKGQEVPLVRCRPAFLSEVRELIAAELSEGSRGIEASWRFTNGLNVGKNALCSSALSGVRRPNAGLGKAAETV